MTEEIKSIINNLDEQIILHSVIKEPISGNLDKAIKLSVAYEELLEKNHELIKKIEQKENETKNLISYLKNEDADLKENVIILEKKLRSTSKESFYYNSYLKTLHRFRAKRELIKEILSKIERENI